MKARAQEALFVLALLAAWHGLALSGIFPLEKLPFPGQVFRRLLEMSADGALWGALKVSLGRVLLGYLLACVMGVSLGVLIFQYSWAARSFGYLVPGFLSLPAACWLPIALLWYADSPEHAIQLMILFGAVFSITHGTEQGMRHVNPVLVRAARTMGSSGWHLSRSVLLPAAAPAMVTGLKQGWAFAWRALMTAELLTQGLGFGNLLKEGQQKKDMAMLLALILVIMAVGWLVDFLVFSPLQNKLRKEYGLEQ